MLLCSTVELAIAATALGSFCFLFAYIASEIELGSLC